MTSHLPLIYLSTVLIVGGTVIASQLPSLAADESTGPADQGKDLPQNLNGDVNLGREVFRFETFGNEGFWTDAVRLPAGVKAAKVTPLRALQLGLQIDSEKVSQQISDRLQEDLRKDPTGA